MKKTGRPSKGSQYHFRRKTFSFYQYWLMYYTERYIDGSEKDFASFIKAKSYQTAKTILVSKLKESTKKIKVKALIGYMMHKDYQNHHLNDKLSLTDWSNIQSSAFPNLSNVLFKEELSRPDGYTNKYNKTDLNHIKSIGFKKGVKNWSTLHRKGKTLPLDERKGMKWNGDRWLQWDKEEMQKAKNQIINALIINNNNRSRAADYLSLSRSGFYALMTRCETREWWNQNYPFAKRKPPRVSKEKRSITQKKVMQKRKEAGLDCFPNRDNEEFQAKRRANLKIVLEKKKTEYAKTLVPKIKEALTQNGNIRAEAARSLGLKGSTFTSWLKKTRFLVDWHKEYPSSYDPKKQNK